MSGVQLFGQPGWLIGFLSLCALHTVCYIIAASSDYRNSALSKRPHLAAHFLPQLLGFMALAYVGGGSWLMEMPLAEVSIGDHLYVGERVSSIMIAFQMYEIAATIPAPRLRGAAYEMVLHHCITLLLSVLAYKYQAYHYWAPCFMGLSEVSSIPLAFLDFFKQVLVSPLMCPCMLHSCLSCQQLLSQCLAADSGPDLNKRLSSGSDTTCGWQMRSSQKSDFGCRRQMILSETHSQGSSYLSVGYIGPIPRTGSGTPRSQRSLPFPTHRNHPLQ